MKTSVRAMVLCLGAAVMLLGATRPALAQDPASPPPDPAAIAAKQDSATMDFFRRTEVSGFVDMYYTYNFNTPTKSCGTVGGVAIYNCLYNFNVAHNSFSLNMAELAFEKKPTADSRGGFRIDLDYGPAAAMVHGFEPGGTAIFQNIEQAYVSYLAPTGTGLQLDFGKFVTPAGNEVIETKDNWNYSRGLLFALAIPYYHMGVRASYSPTDKVSLAGYLVNGWNNAVDNNSGKTVIGAITLKPTAAVTIIENYITGPEGPTGTVGSNWRNLSDTVVNFTATKQVSLAANYDYAQDKLGTVTSTWQGIAGYARFQPNDVFAFTPRVEYFDDQNGFATGTAQKLTEVTLTGEVKAKDGVVMRFEYRHDNSNVPFFLQDAGTLKKGQDTFTIGFVYAFSTKAS